MNLQLSISCCTSMRTALRLFFLILEIAVNFPESLFFQTHESFFHMLVTSKAFSFPIILFQLSTFYLTIIFLIAIFNLSRSNSLAIKHTRIRKMLIPTICLQKILINTKNFFISCVTWKLVSIGNINNNRTFVNNNKKSVYLNWPEYIWVTCNNIQSIDFASHIQSIKAQIHKTIINLLNYYPCQLLRK